MATRQPINTPDLFQLYGPHGNPNPLYIGAYRKGCRCPECVETYTAYRREYHAKRMARDPEYQKKTVAARKAASENLRVKMAAAAAIAASKVHVNPSWAVGHSGYVKGCRCLGCVTGTRDYKRQLHARSRLTPEGRLVTLNANRRKWSRIKSDADRMARVNQKSKVRRDRIRKWVNDIKVGRGCIDCGFNAHPVALDFDHVRGRKHFTIGQAITMSRRRVLDEIAKCEVRCSNCHRIRTHERLSEKTSDAAPPTQ